jgi:hypothetical protein
MLIFYIILYRLSGRMLVDGANCDAYSLRHRFLSATGVVNDMFGTMYKSIGKTLQTGGQSFGISV